MTSTRKVNFKVFGKPATKTVREPKRFKYDSGPFAGKEVNVSREELFDSNLAVFNDAGDLTGGLLYAAKKFGLKLDANEVGAMLKLNPINRLQAVELGTPKGAIEKLTKTIEGNENLLTAMAAKYERQGKTEIKDRIGDLKYFLRGVKEDQGKTSIDDFLRQAKGLRDGTNITTMERNSINKMIGDVTKDAAPLKMSKTRYQNETNYTLQGGKDYRETIFTLPEDIPTNYQLRNPGGHFGQQIGDVNNIYHVRYDTRFTPDGKKVFMINEIQSDVNQSVAKALTKNQQLSGEFRNNPFNADVEINLLIGQRGKLLDDLNKAIDTQDFGRVNAVKATLDDVSKKLSKMTQARSYSDKNKDFYPMVEADSYGDHAVKYLAQKAARENVDYIAVAPFDKLSFRQGYKEGNERFYGYANGKGIGKKGKAVLPDVMARLARFYGTKSGPTKISYSDPSLPYKRIGTNNFTYPEKHPLKNKRIKSTYHVDAQATKPSGDDFKFMEPNDPRLFFDAFAIKVSPLMRQTQKTYKSQGGLVVDIFNTIRYN